MGRTFLFLLSRDLEIDSSFEKYFYLDDSIGFPDENTIKYIIQKFFEDQNDFEIPDEMIVKCKGLTQGEIDRVLGLAYIKSQQMDNQTSNMFDIDKMLELIHREKKQIIRKSSLVELIDIEEDMVEVKGLDDLREWLEVKGKIINHSLEAAENFVDVPRGVLLIGMPGCGKSLCAKYTAKLFNIPLLKIDMGNLMNKYVGESEHNFRAALKLAEATSPCVLWVDELEKAFGGSESEKSQSETSSRILGYLLTWMQEKKTLTFVVATANDVKKLPPELLRKGRFDETFFVDLPNEKERAEIFKAHLKKRGISFDECTDVAKDTNNYSGAEIEYVVRDVTEKRFINILNGKSGYVDKEMFERPIDETIPLYKTMKDELDAMKNFCKERKFREASKTKKFSQSHNDQENNNQGESENAS